MNELVLPTKKCLVPIFSLKLDFMLKGREMDFLLPTLPIPVIRSMLSHYFVACDIFPDFF